MAGLAVVRKADVAASQVDAGVVAGEDDERIFPTVAVMGFAAVGKVKEHRVVEHRAVALGHTLEALDDAVNDLHVVRARQLANGLRRKPADAFVMADIVHVHLLTLDARETSIAMAKFVDGKGNNIGEAGNQRAQQHLAVADLAVEGVDGGIEIFVVQLGNVFADDIRHRVDLAVALANGFHGVGVILHLRLFDTRQRIGDGAFVAGNELEYLAVQLILRARLGIGGNRLEKLLQRDARRAEGVVGLLRSAGGKAGGHAVKAAPGIAATERKTGQLNVAGWRRKQLGQFEINCRPLDGAEAFIGLEHAQ